MKDFSSDSFNVLAVFPLIKKKKKSKLFNFIMERAFYSVSDDEMQIKSFTL